MQIGIRKFCVYAEEHGNCLMKLLALMKPLLSILLEHIHWDSIMEEHKLIGIRLTSMQMKKSCIRACTFSSSSNLDDWIAQKIAIRRPCHQVRNTMALKHKNLYNGRIGASSSFVIL